MILKTVSRFHLSAFAHSSAGATGAQQHSDLAQAPVGEAGEAAREPLCSSPGGDHTCPGPAAYTGLCSSLPARPLCSDTWLLCYKKRSAGATGLCSRANIYTGMTVCVFSVSSAFSSVCNKQGMCSKCMPASMLLQIPVQIGKPLLPYQYPMQSSLLPMTSGEADKRTCFPSYLPIFSCNHQDNLLLKAMIYPIPFHHMGENKARH